MADWEVSNTTYFVSVSARTVSGGKAVDIRCHRDMDGRVFVTLPDIPMRFRRLVQKDATKFHWRIDAGGGRVFEQPIMTHFMPASYGGVWVGGFENGGLFLDWLAGAKRMSILHREGYAELRLDTQGLDELTRRFRTVCAF